jgi:hypothetical protein
VALDVFIDRNIAPDVHNNVFVHRHRGFDGLAHGHTPGSAWCFDWIERLKKLPTVYIGVIIIVVGRDVSFSVYYYYIILYYYIRGARTQGAAAAAAAVQSLL